MINASRSDNNFVIEKLPGEKYVSDIKLKALKNVAK
jgi:hypothetical protein